MHLYSFILSILLVLSPSYSISQQEQKKIDVQQAQIQYRDSIGLKYGQNTETITFAVERSVDFVIKMPHQIEVKGTLHTYWKQQNIYISSEYREGQNIRLVLYEDNYRILQDRKFYVATGFSFLAEQGKVYTLRLIDEGRITKLVSMELSKTSSTFQNAATLDEYAIISKKISSVGQQIKALLSISQFSDIMHEQNSVNVNHATCIYMSYLMVEAFIVIILVVMQVRYMTKMLSQDSIV